MLHYIFSLFLKIHWTAEVNFILFYTSYFPVTRSNTSLDIMTFLKFTCHGWGPVNDSFTYDLMIKTEENFLRIVSDKIVTTSQIVGQHIQLPLGNMTIVIRIKNKFLQYVDYEVAFIEVCDPEIFRACFRQYWFYSRE